MVGRRETAARTDQFRKQQLEQFYGPLLAMHKEIRARSELRVKLQNAIDTLYIREMWRAGPGKPVEVSDEHLSAIFICDNEELTRRERDIQRSSHASLPGDDKRLS